MSATDIRAAGGLLWRSGGAGVEVAVVHRPRYDDWSLPKGKLDGREEPLLAAVREVGEETGRLVRVGRRLQTVRYDVGNQAKAVQYWSMRDTGPLGSGEIGDVDEVGALEWLPVDEVGARLSYADDRSVLDGFRRIPETTSVVALVRHARAGKRVDWDGDDRLRPLDERGEIQAAALGPLLETFGPTAVFAADRVRCEQTVAPLAARLDLAVTSMPEVSDESYEADPAAAVEAVTTLALQHPVTVVCSQGTALPGILEQWLPPRLLSTVSSTVTRKAAWWVVGVRAGVPVWIDRYDRPRP
ncbi:NUDIX hydrolase [Jatrophihabitans sp. YIM 134969]